MVGRVSSDPELLALALAARERQVAELRAELAELTSALEHARSEASGHEREAKAQRERADATEREAIAQRERADALAAATPRKGLLRRR
jgi:hypothetical protein